MGEATQRWTSMPGRRPALAAILGCTIGLLGCAGTARVQRGTDGGSEIRLTLVFAATQAMPALEGAVPGRLSGALIPVVAPAAVAIIGPFVFYADAALGEVLRLDLTRQALTRLPGLRATPGVRLRSGAAGTFYLLDAPRGVLLQLDLQGRVITEHRDRAPLAGVSDIAADPYTGRLIIANGVTRRIYDAPPSLGVLAEVPLRQDERLRIDGIDAIAAGAEAWYVTDPHSRRIARITREGVVTQTFGSDAVAWPGTIAVDRYERVFVIDRADGSVHAFRHGRHLTRLSSATLGLARAADLAIAGAELAVVGQGGGVRVFHLDPPKEARP